MQPLRRTLNTGERPPYISSHSSRIKSKQGANRRSIITKANIQKALSVSALLRHPLPLQPPSLALVLPPSLHPTPPSSVRLPPPPSPSLPLLPLPQMHFLHLSLPFFSPSSSLFLFLFLSSCLHSIQSCSRAVPPPPTHTLTHPPLCTHTHSALFFYFFNQPLTHVCLHPSLPLF